MLHSSNSYCPLFIDNNLVLFITKKLLKIKKKKTFFLKIKPETKNHRIESSISKNSGSPTTTTSNSKEAVGKFFVVVVAE